MAQGKQVWVAQPHHARQDYNDVLVQQGQTAVKGAWKRRYLMMNIAG